MEKRRQWNRNSVRQQQPLNEMLLNIYNRQNLYVLLDIRFSFASPGRQLELFHTSCVIQYYFSFSSGNLVAKWEQKTARKGRTYNIVTCRMKPEYKTQKIHQLLGNGTVNTFPRQRTRDTTIENCWKRWFLCDQCRGYIWRTNWSS
jgi:hypothetical protein